MDKETPHAIIVPRTFGKRRLQAALRAALEAPPPANAEEAEALRAALEALLPPAGLVSPASAEAVRRFVWALILLKKSEVDKIEPGDNSHNEKPDTGTPEVHADEFIEDSASEMIYLD